MNSPIPKVEPIKQHTFKARLTERGIGDYKGTRGQRYWKGIRLVTEQDFSGKSGKTNGNADTSGKEWQGFPETLYTREIRKKFTEKPATLATNDSIPAYPTEPCRCGCGDYWLTGWNQWLCCRCHPEPQGGGR